MYLRPTLRRNLTTARLGMGLLGSVGATLASFFGATDTGFALDASNYDHAQSMGTWRRNLFTRTEDAAQDAGTRSGVTVTSNTGQAPDSSLTADTLTIPVNSYHYWRSSENRLPGDFTGSIWVRASAPVSIPLRINSYITGSNQSFSTKIVTTEWQRVSETFALGAQDKIEFGFDNRSAFGGGAGDVTIEVAFRQLETGSVATAYQKVVSAREVTEAGQPSLAYLYFDGIDDALATAGNVDLTGTDAVSLFAGVRKESDGASSALVELGNSRPIGSFSLFAPSSTDSYAYISKGSADGDARASGFAAPHTAVLSGLSDISADSSDLRVNGVQRGASALEQGTGNYGSYPLHIGARNQTSLYFKGNLYGLALRGALSTADEINIVERWLAQRTGVTI